MLEEYLNKNIIISALKFNMYLYGYVDEIKNNRLFSRFVLQKVDNDVYIHYCINMVDFSSRAIEEFTIKEITKEDCYMLLKDVFNLKDYR